MKVVLLVDRAAARGLDRAGRVVDVSADEARRMIEAGQAHPARQGAEPEAAVPGEVPERAAAPRKARRKGSEPAA